MSEMGQAALAVVTSDVDVFDDRRLAMVRDKFANGAPQDEFNLFIEFCRSRNLDPLQRQVYLIPRSSKDANGKWNKTWSIQTSIDGYRAIADRTGAYAGSDEAVYAESGKKVGDPAKERPDTATMTVWRLVQGIRCPFTATARWDEYYQDTSPLWKRMPHTMLAKCAESLALRKAFPVQLGGVYTAEEMMQAGPVVTPGARAAVEAMDMADVSWKVADAPLPDSTVETRAAAPEAEPACPDRSGGDDERSKQNRRYHGIGASHGWSDAALHLLAVSSFPYHNRVRTTSRSQLTAGELERLGTAIEDTIGRQVDEATGVIIPTPEVEQANKIAIAQDQRTLAEIAAKLKADGIEAPWITRMWAYRNREVPAHSASLMDVADGPEGEPGQDKWTA